MQAGRRGTYKKEPNAHRAVIWEIPEDARRNGPEQGKKKTTGGTHADIPNRQRKTGETDNRNGTYAATVYMPKMQKRLHHYNGKDKAPRTQPGM